MIGSCGTSSSRRGFTLIELLGVIAVMIIMSTIVVGGFFSIMKGYAVRSAMNHFRSAAEVARQRASMQGQRVYFWISQPSAELFEYVVIQQAGVVTDGSRDRDAKIIIDQFADLSAFRPDLVNPGARRRNDYINTRVYNLGSHTHASPSHRVFTINEKDTQQELKLWGDGQPLTSRDAGGWQIPLLRADGTAMGDTDWHDGDRYGWEVYPPFQLPRGFSLELSGSTVDHTGVHFYFEPSGAVGPSSSLPAVFELVEDESDTAIARITIESTGEITTELLSK